MNWDFTPPKKSTLADTDVRIQGKSLKGKKIALLITGCIAAYKMPDLARDMRKQGADVHCFLSKSALNFVAESALEWLSGNKVYTNLTAASEHLEDKNPFDIYLIAPATYNTINKFADGYAEELITTILASALGRLENNECKIFAVPAMHGSMHNSILTKSMKNLSSKNVVFIKPKQEDGKNKLPELENIIAEIAK